MDIVLQQVPCREEQISKIYNMIRYKNEPIPSVIFIYGHTASGKSLVLSKILQCLGCCYAIVNCIETYSVKLIFESILYQLGHSEVKCENFLEFTRNLSMFSYENRIIIVLDKCEKLREKDKIIETFMYLQELTNVNVNVFMISNIVWEKFYPKNGVKEPVIIEFPQYDKEELSKLLVLDRRPNEYSEEFYQNYINLFLGVFFRACRDFNELQYLARSNFAHFVQPIKEEKADENDMGLLWRNIVPKFKVSLGNLYLRMHDYALKERENSKINVDSCSGFPKGIPFELPYYSKYLLIAAYLASHNSPKNDKRLFMKFHGKERKLKKTKSVKQTDKLIGPKHFTLDRLLAIFYAIMEERTNLTSNLLSQISSLVKLQLLILVGNYRLDAPKFRCGVGFNFIKNVGISVGLNISKYLL